jgi:uncharacterized membrane protein
MRVEMPKNKGHNKGRSITPTRSAIPVEAPPDMKPEVARRHSDPRTVGGVTVTTTEYYAGILPRPDDLERFEVLHPGTTDRYLGMAERQSAHRQRMERTFLHYNGVSQIFGVLFAGIALIGGIAGGIYLLANGKNLEGFSTMIVAIGSAVGVYRWGQKSQAAEKERKDLARRR